MPGWVFWVLGVLLLALIVLRLRARALARRRRRARPLPPTGTAALVGRPAIVIERIANDEGVGCVKIDGQVWTARSLLEDQVIESGTRVDVVEIRGATALVCE
jgi:membrane protein implicated in regulation of membrane protease activity